jgi:hypothetical protein
MKVENYELSDQMSHILNRRSRATFWFVLSQWGCRFVHHSD